MSDWDDDPVPAARAAPPRKALVDDWSDDEETANKWNGGSARGGARPSYEPSRGRGGGSRGWQDDQVQIVLKII
jgi:hypothetical protein